MARPKHGMFSKEHQSKLPFYRFYGSSNVERWLDNYYLNSLEATRKKEDFGRRLYGSKDPVEA